MPYQTPDGLQILVVDDDTATLSTLHAILRKEGFEVDTAENGAEARKKVTLREPDLVLLDVNMPGENGLDVCRSLKLQPATAEIPVLFLSISEDVSTKVAGFAAGASDFITKPCHPDELLARVRLHIRLRQAYRVMLSNHVEQIKHLAETQQSLMPTPDQIPDAKFHVYLQQVHSAGGDFYDVVRSGNDIVDYVIADASGHHLGASLWTASFKALMSQYASILHSPLEICRTLNDALRRLLPESAYFSAIYARVNRVRNRITLVNAGHPSAILSTASGREIRRIDQSGDLLGIFEDAAFDVEEIAVRPGDSLLLYTDGLIEMGCSREEETKRLLDLCRLSRDSNLAEVVPSIAGAMRDGRHPQDDIVLLGIRV